jgi:two-component sensor histidine kinase
MLTAPALSTAVPASADDRETACRGQTAHLVEKGFRPMNGLLALGERPAGVVAVTAISALLSRISGSTQLGFGDYLRDLCDDLAAMSGRSGGPKLTCAAADATLPIGAAITLGLIADLLITNAFLYAFPPGRGGGIAVSFAAGQEAWLLTVEDRGIAMRARDSRCENGLTIARLLVVRLGGRLKIPIVTGGTRCIVTIPRPMRASTSASQVASMPVGGSRLFAEKAAVTFFKE